MLGLSIGKPDFFPTLEEIARELDEVDAATFALSASLLALALVLRRFARAVPGALVVVVLAIVLSVTLDLEDHGVAVVGDLDGGLPSPEFPSVGFQGILDLLLPAVTIALVSFADTIALTRSYARMRNEPLDPNRELAGLGGANLIAGFTQAFPVGSSASRTTLNASSGGGSQLVGLVALVIVGVVLLVGTRLIEPLPTAALGVVVTVAALGLLDVRSIWRLRHVRADEVALATVAALGVLLFGVFGGVVVAVGLSIGLFVYRTVRPHDAVLGRVDDIDSYHDVERYTDATVLPGLIVYRFDATLFFPNADHFRQQVLALVEDADPPARWLMVNAETFVYIDSTAIDTLTDLHAELTDRGVSLMFAKVKGELLEIFEETGFLDVLGRENVFPTVRAGVAAFAGADRPES
jgi:sulfate permease, SulP family